MAAIDDRWLMEAKAMRSFPIDWSADHQNRGQKQEEVEQEVDQIRLHNKSILTLLTPIIYLGESPSHFQ